MEPFILQEVSRRSITITKTIRGCLQWGDSPLALLTDKGLSIYDYTYKISNLEKKIALVEYCIPCPKTSPAAELFPATLTNNFISNMNYNQMQIDPALWPHNTELMKGLAAVTSYRWSPPELCYKNACILAIITNMGTIELYGRQRRGWNSILNLSEVIKPLYNHKAPLKKIGQSIDNLESLKTLAMSLETCAMCWCPNLCEGPECYLVVAQKNGDLLFWLLTSDNAILRADLVMKHSVNVSEITSLHCIPLPGKQFLIMYSNVLGQLFGLECEVKDGTIITKRTISLWVYQDRMVVRHLKYMSSGGKVVVIYTKHRNLVVQMLDDSFQILSQCLKNINQNKITVLTQDQDNLYVCTADCKIYRIILTVSKNNFDIECSFSLISIKECYTTSEVCGFAVSKNSTLWALCLIDRKVSSRKEQKMFDIVFFRLDNKQSELLKLLKNPTNSLQEMWDCLEMLRYKCVKSRSLPQIDYDQLYAEAFTDVYKLKLYLNLLKIYKSDEIMTISCKIKLPETSVEKVKETILLKHAQSIIEEFSDGDKLEGIDLESFIFASKYIEFYCKKYKCQTTDYRQPCKINFSDTEYRCESCDDILLGFDCRNGHTNMFCTVTFTPIVSDDYIYCTGCDATARSEVYSKTCVFCDIPFNKFD